MATWRWVGSAEDVAMVIDATPGGTLAIGEVLTLTVGGATVSFTVAAAGDVGAAVAGLVAAWNASDAPQVQEATAKDVTSTKAQLTGDVDGQPITVTGSATGGSTLTVTTDTTATGKNHWNNDQNWRDTSDAAGQPAASDTVVFDAGSSEDVLYGLDQSSTVLSELTIENGYTGRIGNPDRHPNGYNEYRDKNLQVGATNIRIGDGEGQGSGRIRIDTGTDQTTIVVQNTGPSLDQTNGTPALIWFGTHASNAVSVLRGSVGIGFFADQTATVSTLRIGYRENVERDAVVSVGEGVTLATVEKYGGVFRSNSGISSTLNSYAGESVLLQGAWPTVNVRGGSVRYNTTGTLTTATVSGEGHLDFSQDPRAKTVTNPIERYGNLSRLSDPGQLVSSLVVDLNESSNLDLLQLGINVRLTRGTPA